MQMRLDHGAWEYASGRTVLSFGETPSRDVNNIVGVSSSGVLGSGPGSSGGRRYCYYTDLVAAHAVAGLARCVAVGTDR